MTLFIKTLSYGTSKQSVISSLSPHVIKIFVNIEMPGRTDPKVEHRILGFLEANWTPNAIIKHFKTKNIKIWPSLITKIKKRK